MKEQLAKMTIIELVRTAHSYSTSIKQTGVYSELVREMASRLEALNLAHIGAIAALSSTEKDRDQLATENVSLKDENEYIRNRFKETDRLFGKNILVMQAAIIDWRATSDAKNGMAWIFNTLLGPGELPDEAEKDAQEYFDRKYAPIDAELMELYGWFLDRQRRLKAKQTAETSILQAEGK